MDYNLTVMTVNVAKHLLRPNGTRNSMLSDGNVDIENRNDLSRGMLISSWFVHSHRVDGQDPECRALAIFVVESAHDEYDLLEVQRQRHRREQNEKREGDVAGHWHIYVMTPTDYLQPFTQVAPA